RTPRREVTPLWGMRGALHTGAMMSPRVHPPWCRARGSEAKGRRHVNHAHCAEQEQEMVLADFGSGQVLWSVLWIFMFVIWFWLLIAIFGDLMRDDSLSGWAKAAWCFFVIILPFLGIFVYLIVRGHAMGERAMAP